MTAQFHIRPATVADAPALLDIYRPFVESTAVSFDLVPPSVEEFAARVAASLAAWQWLIAERAGRCLGFAYAGITLPNDASVALHRAVGFEPVGVFRSVGHKFGSWQDVAWLQRTLREGPPDEERRVVGA